MLHRILLCEKLSYILYQIILGSKISFLIYNSHCSRGMLILKRKKPVVALIHIFWHPIQQEREHVFCHVFLGKSRKISQLRATSTQRGSKVKGHIYCEMKDVAWGLQWTFCAWLCVKCFPGLSYFIILTATPKGGTITNLHTAEEKTGRLPEVK